MRQVRVVCGTIVCVLAVSLAYTSANAKDKKSLPDADAIQRAQKEVQKLDLLYKTTVVGITKTYVNQQFDTPAAVIAADVFKTMHEKGFHYAHLVDATGNPKIKESIAKNAFEKAAVKAMKEGKQYYEQIDEVKGQPVLRAATVLPAVMKACASCHGVKEGDLLGAIVYEVPIK